MKTLIIGDTHFHDSNTALRNAQIQAADVLYEHAMYQRCDRVVFLGDVFDKRKPSPACILDVKEFFDNVQIPTHIIRGNHDSANKSDDGLTILSLLHRDGMVEVHNRWSHRGSHVYLSHFEHEEQIKALLAAAWPDDTVLFGHFGFDGALNNAGDADCALQPSDFRHKTILGHIHQHMEVGNITVLGTPWDTCFHDAGQKYYGVLDGTDLTLRKFNLGPTYLTLTPATLDQIPANEEHWGQYICVRLVLAKEDVGTYNTNNLKELYPQVKHWDIKYAMSYDEEQLSTYQGADLFSINDQIIEDYLDEAKTSWTKEQLLDVLNEDQED